MKYQKPLLGVFLILFIAVSAFYYSSIYVPDKVETHKEKKIYANITADITVTNQTVIRGKNYKLNVQLTSNATASLNSISLTLHDITYNRTGTQMISLNQTIAVGSNEFQLSLSPAFQDGQGAVISEVGGKYQLVSYTVMYNTTQPGEVSGDLSINLGIQDTSFYNQADKFQWNVTQNQSVITADGGNITISSIKSSGFELTTVFNGTGYPRIDLIANQTNSGDVLLYYIDDNLQIPTGNIIPIGNYFDYHNLTIRGTISAGASTTIQLALWTKATILFAVIADNNFAAPSGENLKFRDPEFYIKQMSYHFETVFNFTIVPAKTVPIASPTSTDLNNFATATIQTVGTKLELPQASWNIGPGISPDNQGYDLLLILTNDTMDHLGVVYGNASGEFNIAICARGTQYTGKYRLPPSFADNLIQHEVSHIFGAPDRFTSSSLPSIMTKSQPDQALADLISNQFWLDRINWLEPDIQTMTNVMRTVFWPALPSSAVI